MKYFVYACVLFLALTGRAADRKPDYLPPEKIENSALSSLPQSMRFVPENVYGSRTLKSYCARNSQTTVCSKSRRIKHFPIMQRNHTFLDFDADGRPEIVIHGKDMYIIQHDKAGLWADAVKKWLEAHPGAKLLICPNPEIEMVDYKLIKAGASMYP
jgi:hypothetical protein